jgi:hypothetical protein
MLLGQVDNMVGGLTTDIGWNLIPYRIAQPVYYILLSIVNAGFGLFNIPRGTLLFLLSPFFCYRYFVLCLMFTSSFTILLLVLGLIFCLV